MKNFNQETKYFTIKYKDVWLNGYVEYVDKEEYCYFFHPVTSRVCEDIDQCFFGWSEQDEETNKNWDKLVEKFEEDNEIWEWIGMAGKDEVLEVIYNDEKDTIYNYVKSE